MRKGELSTAEARMLASLEGTLKEYNEGRGVRFVLVNIKSLEETARERETITKVEVLGNMPQEIVRHTLTKVLVSLISDEVEELHAEHVCDDCKDKTH